jgi:hypothetical protein
MSEPEYSQENPRAIKTEFRYQGHVLRQLKRQGDVAIYERFGQVGTLLLGYEVVRIRVREPHIFPNGTQIPWAETYPQAEIWGTYGFTYQARDLKGAETRFAKMAVKTFPSAQISDSEPETIAG